jgi:hypothetical protein
MKNVFDAFNHDFLKLQKLLPTRSKKIPKTPPPCDSDGWGQSKKGILDVLLKVFNG